MKKQIERVGCSGQQRGSVALHPAKGARISKHLQCSGELAATLPLGKTGLRELSKHWPYPRPSIDQIAVKKSKIFDALQKPAYNHLIGW
jgi:hypothetical protein